MNEWIYVDTATKTPAVRSNRTSPIENFEDGVDPNSDQTPYGPAEEWMFVPVVRDITPVVNNVLERLDAYSTLGHDEVSYPGKYVDPDWIIGWDILPQEIQASRDYKLDALNDDKSVAIAAGYAVGPYAFPFSEDFFRLLSDRHYWMDLAIAAGTIQPNHKITFSDMNGKEVQVTFAQIQTQLIAYGYQFIAIEEEEVAARGEIQDAATVGAVDAVTWDFS